MSRNGKGRRRSRRDPGDDDVEIILPELPPLIEEGIYEAVCVESRRGQYRTVPKLETIWEITLPDPDAPDGLRRVRLRRFYNASDFGQRTATAGPHSNVAREIRMLTGRGLSSNQRFPMKSFRGIAAVIAVRTVRCDGRQHKLHETSHYSLIDRIVDVTSGRRDAVPASQRTAGDRVRIGVARSLIALLVFVPFLIRDLLLLLPEPSVRERAVCAIRATPEQFEVGVPVGGHRSRSPRSSRDTSDVSLSLPAPGVVRGLGGENLPPRLSSVRGA